MDERLLKEILEDLRLRQERSALPVPLGISNRHMHLTKEHFRALFGSEKMSCVKDLKQPGQFACGEVVTVEGPKGSVKNVRVLGPFRPASQVEISLSDSRRLGVEPPVRDSGKLEGTPGIRLTGPEGSVALSGGVIISKRHIHFHTVEAEKYRVRDGQEVRVLCGGGTEKEVIFERVLCRVSDKYSLELHLDTDEAAAAGLKNNDPAYIV